MLAILIVITLAGLVGYTAGINKQPDMQAIIVAGVVLAAGCVLYDLATNLSLGLLHMTVPYLAGVAIGFLRRR